MISSARFCVSARMTGTRGVGGCGRKIGGMGDGVKGLALRAGLEAVFGTRSRGLSSEAAKRRRRKARRKEGRKGLHAEAQRRRGAEYAGNALRRPDRMCHPGARRNPWTNPQKQKRRFLALRAGRLVAPKAQSLKQSRHGRPQGRGTSASLRLCVPISKSTLRADAAGFFSKGRRCRCRRRGCRRRSRRGVAAGAFRWRVRSWAERFLRRGGGRA